MVVRGSQRLLYRIHVSLHSSVVFPVIRRITSTQFIDFRKCNLVSRSKPSRKQEYRSVIAWPASAMRKFDFSGLMRLARDSRRRRPTTALFARRARNNREPGEFHNGMPGNQPYLSSSPRDIRSIRTQNECIIKRAAATRYPSRRS